MKFALLIAALTAGCLAQTGNIVFDAFGNKGLGEGNDYAGTANTWIGDRNQIYGAENAVNGNDNAVHGLHNDILGNVNNIDGKDNQVVGGGNRVVGEGNIIQGTGNIIASDASDLGFDIQSRLPAWMRTKKADDNKVARPATPQKPATTERPALTPPRATTGSVSPGRWNQGRSPINRVDIPIIPLIPQFQIPQVSQFQVPRRPSFREVVKSPGKTEIREVYVTPNSRQQVFKSFSTSSSFVPERNLDSWNWNRGGDWAADWNRVGQMNRGNHWNRGDWAGNQWGNGNNQWINGNNQWGARNSQFGNQWGNQFNNDAQEWGNRFRRDAEKSAQDLRAKIQNEVRQNLDRAFSNAFF